MVRVYKHSKHGDSGGEWLTPVRYSSKGFKWTIKAWVSAKLPNGLPDKQYLTIMPKGKISAAVLSDMAADFWEECIDEYNEREAVDIDFGFWASAR